MLQGLLAALGGGRETAADTHSQASQGGFSESIKKSGIDFSIPGFLYKNFGAPSQNSIPGLMPIFHRARQKTSSVV